MWPFGQERQPTHIVEYGGHSVPLREPVGTVDCAVHEGDELQLFVSREDGEVERFGDRAASNKSDAGSSSIG